MGGLGSGAVGLPPRDLPPLEPGRGRPGGERPVRHQRGTAGDVHHPPAPPVRRDAGAGGPAGGPLRSPRRDARGRRDSDPRAGRVRPRRELWGGGGRPRLRRRRRRDDLDLPAAAGEQLVHRTAHPVPDLAQRHARTDGRTRRGGADDLGAGPPGLDAGLPRRGRRRRTRDRGGGDRRPRHTGGPGAARTSAHPRRRRGEPARQLGPPGHPARVLDALRDPVQRDRDDVAVGLPVPGAGRGSARPGPASC